MTDHQLRCFVAIFEARTISGAAQRLRLAVSALSHHLANLEEGLGVRLFERHRRGVEPTAAGQRLYAHARKILADMREAARDVRSGHDSVTGEVAVGLAGSAMRAIGFPLIETVRRDYPDLRLVVSESLSEIVMSELAASKIDIALAFNPQATDAIRIEPLLEEELGLVGRAEVIGSELSPVTFDSVLEHDLILLRQGLSARALTQDTTLLKRLEERASLQVNSIHAISEFLRAGLGATLGTRHIFRDALEAGLLTYRPVTHPDLTRFLAICERVDRTPTFALERVRSLLRDHLAASVKAGQWEARMLI